MTTAWGLIFLLYGIGIVAAGQLGIVPPLLPQLRRDLDLSLTTAGAVVSTVTLMGALFGLVAGNWCERIGHVRALRLGLLVMLAAAAACSLSDGALTLLVGRGVAGLGYLVVVVACPTLMAQASARRHQPLALSLWSTFVPVGMAVTGFAAASASALVGWRLLFAVDAAAMAIALVLAIVFVPSMASPARPPQASPVGTLRPAFALAAAFFCFALLFLALAGLLPAFLVEQRRTEASSAGQVVASATAFGIVGSLAAGWTMRHGRASLGLGALGLIASTLAASFALLVRVPIELSFAVFAASFALGGVVPAIAFASVPLVAGHPHRIGPINGLLAQAGSLGSLAGPPLLALWVHAVGWSLAPVFLLTIAAVGAAFMLAARRPPG
jgi:MFS family permease